MSYAFTLNFKNIEKNDVLDFICDFKVKVKEEKSIAKILKDNKHYAPSYKYEDMGKNKNININRILNDTDRYWLNKLLSFTFIYWEKFNLLALVGEYDNNISDMFDTHICFQNSSDQDYDERTYDKLEIAKPIIEEINSLSDEDFYKIYIDDDLYDFEEYLENPQYLRRTQIYENLFEKLQLNDFLWGDDTIDGGDMKIIKINVIKDSYEELMIKEKLSKLKERKC